MGNFWNKIKKPITVLAPMADVTDYAFRKLINETARPDVFFTEFVSTDGLFSKGRTKIDHRLKFDKSQSPIVAQIWGTDPDLFYKTAIELQKMDFDGVDINMGCPDKAVMKKGAGAALVNSKQLVSDLINSLRKGAPKLSVSVKTRLDETKKLTLDWFEFLLSQNIDTLTVHARRAKDLSKGSAKWNMLGELVELKNKINPQITVIGNGDVVSYKQVLEKHKKYGVDGVMIGRGIFKNPWVFEQSLEPVKHTKEEYFELMKKHTQLFHETWGNTKNFEIMKKFFKIYVKGYRGAHEFRKQLMEVKSYKEVMHLLAE